MAHSILKYVMTAQGPVIFPFEIQHDVFEALNPTSAGAVMIQAGTLDAHAYGESMSLGLRSIEIQDSTAINKMLGVK